MFLLTTWKQTCYSLQISGTFATKETLVDVKKFVCEHINTEWAPYTLKMATGQAIEEETKTLEKLNLVS